MMLISTELTSYTLPTYISFLVGDALTLTNIVSTNTLHSLLENLWGWIGTPKYPNGNSPVCNPVI